ncbi:hypothetical protein MAPG_10638 [Magnaporthiopsis poae ATCC 64411]|uniref:Uncharacterized protein n=1 Tax=Magnaporthiopsis poae (strain ATCC 64411 / 73-15) TaxID=644358 RepID=A0A0C4ED45_MAGP6|nr:hypothetical protein MAPG_10638 [Magnaporthiopsis poae ATCC 64411]
MWSPLGHGPFNATAQWHPEPLTRGSFSILASCVVTLSLCLWTSLHLNIPEEGKAGQQKWQKTKWLFVGLIAPEMIAYLAYLQWDNQKRLHSTMLQNIHHQASAREQAKAASRASKWSEFSAYICGKRSVRKKSIELEEAPLSAPPGRRHAWTKVHSFYAVMGGFVLDATTDSGASMLPCGTRRLTLTVNGLEVLAEESPHLISDISKASIIDKSKSNHLAKALVVVQATWFCLQVVTRMGFGLGVSLLELNTFAHAVCALLIYLIWWDKPLDIDEPTVLDIPRDEARRLIAFFYCQSDAVSSPRMPLKPDSKITQTWPGRLFVKATKEPKAEIRKSWQTKGQPSTSRTRHQPSPPPPGIEPFKLSVNGVRRQNDFYLSDVTGPRSLAPWVYLLSHPIEGWKLDMSTFESDYEVEITPPRMELYFEAEQYFAAAGDGTKDCRDLVVKRMANTGYTEGMSRWLISSFFAVSAIYGAWHLMAWEGPFATHTEGLLWRISGCGVAGSGILTFAGLHMTWHLSGWRPKGILYRIRTTFLVILVLGCFCLAPVLLLVSRIYLVVGAFIQLPYSPESVFHLPNWAPYFPHVS